MYGAVGDGGHDDTAAINQAIQAARSTGGRVQLAAGTFLVNQTSIQLASSVELCGVGDETVLKLMDGADTSVVAGDVADPSRPISGAAVTDLRIDGNGDLQSSARFISGINLRSSIGCVVTRVSVVHTARTGIYLAGSNNQVLRCSVSNVGGGNEIGESGIVFDTDGVNLPIGSVANGNSVTGVQEHGIKVYPGGDGSSISENSVTSAGNRGIYVQGAADCTVWGNTVDDVGTTGILVGGEGFPSNRCVVTGNTVRYSGSHGILIWASSAVIVDGENWAEINGGAGIYLLQSPLATIDGARCVGNHQNGGIVLNASSNSTITNNRCLGNEIAGVYFWDQGAPTTDCLVSGNQCADDDWGAQLFGVLSLNGTTRLTMTGNDLAGNLISDMYLSGSNTIDGVIVGSD